MPAPYPLVASRSIWIVFTLAIAILITAAVFVSGPTQIVMGVWDMFIHLDGAWRIQLGQVPHTDFYNPIGVLMYYLISVGLRLGGENITAILYASILFLALVLPIAMFAAFTRLPALLASGLTIFIVTLALATRPLGFEADTPSYAMLYNREGWVLFSIFMLQTFVTIQDRSKSLHTIDAVLAGVVLGLMFVTKISFFLAAGSAVVVAAVLQRTLSFERLALMAAGFLLVCAMVTFIVGVNLVDYLGDLAMTSSVQTPEYRLRFIWLLLKSSKVLVLSFVLVFCLVAYAYLTDHPGRRLGIIQRILAAAYFGFAAILLAAGNAGEERAVEFPFLFVGGIILVYGNWDGRGSLSEKGRRLQMAAVALSALAFVVPTLWKDVQSVAQSWSSPISGTTEVETTQRFATPRLEGFVVPATATWQTVFVRANQVPGRVNEGLELIRKHVKPDDRLLVLGYADPFSYGLSLTPPIGAPLFWHPSQSFNPRVHPQAERVFGDADFVILPRFSPSDDGCCREFVDGILQIYGGYLNQHFALLDTTDHWMLHRRTESLKRTK